MERIGLLVYQGAHAIPGGPPRGPCYTRGPTKAIPGGPPGGPLRLYQGAHQGAHYGSPGGPPGGPLRLTRGPLRVLTSYFCRGMTHEIIIYNRYLRSEIGNVCSITFLSERTVLCFLLSEDDNLCLSDWSELLFLSF